MTTSSGVALPSEVITFWDRMPSKGWFSRQLITYWCNGSEKMDQNRHIKTSCVCSCSSLTHPEVMKETATCTTLLLGNVLEVQSNNLGNVFWKPWKIVKEGQENSVSSTIILEVQRPDHLVLNLPTKTFVLGFFCIFFLKDKCLILSNLKKLGKKLIMQRLINKKNVSSLPGSIKTEWREGQTTGVNIMIVEKIQRWFGRISAGPLIQLPTLCGTAVLHGFTKACWDKSGRFLGRRIPQRWQFDLRSWCLCS